MLKNAHFRSVIYVNKLQPIDLFKFYLSTKPLFGGHLRYDLFFRSKWCPTRTCSQKAPFLFQGSSGLYQVSISLDLIYKKFLHMYKYVIPIGDNCEIAGHLTRNNYHYSSLFRYARCELSQVCMCFENQFKEIFAYENIDPVNKSMVRCRKYNISWHTEISIENIDGNWIFKNKTVDEYKKEITKLMHLKNNIIKALNDKQNKTLFIYKSNIGNFTQLDRFIDTIYSQYTDLDFTLLVVKCKHQMLSNLKNNDRVDVHDVKYLADYNDAMLGGDDKGWNHILSKYINVPKYEEIMFKSFTSKGKGIEDYLHDIAIKFESINDIETAFKLMKHASYCKPNHQSIIEKIQEYKARLKIKE